jgi:hypothetical protein
VVGPGSVSGSTVEEIEFDMPPWVVALSLSPGSVGAVGPEGWVVPVPPRLSEVALPVPLLSVAVPSSPQATMARDSAR